MPQNIQLNQRSLFTFISQSDYENWNSQVIVILVPFHSQWFPIEYKENLTADDRKRIFKSHKLIIFFALRKCFAVNTSLKHLSSIELGLLKFAFVELVWCENFIKSESNAIILRRGLAQL